MRITAPQAHKRESMSWLEEAAATVRAPSCLSKLYFSFREDVTRGSGVLAEARGLVIKPAGRASPHLAQGFFKVKCNLFFTCANSARRGGVGVFGNLASGSR